MAEISAALQNVAAGVEQRYGVPLVLRPYARATRLVLRLDRARRCLTLSFPPRLAARHLDSFLAANTEWIGSQLTRLPAPPTEDFPAEVPVLGVPHRVESVPELGRRVAAQDGAIRIGGAPEFAEARLRRFLVERARAEIVPLALRLADRAERRIAGITLRDTRSRWGSCTRDGRLNFSWRLAMAPALALDYVVAHEVAHLVHMDHSPRFWAVNAWLAQDMDAGRRWLKQHGAGLHLILPNR